MKGINIQQINNTYFAREAARSWHLSCSSKKAAGKKECRQESCRQNANFKLRTNFTSPCSTNLSTSLKFVLVFSRFCFFALKADSLTFINTPGEDDFEKLSEKKKGDGRVPQWRTDGRGDPSFSKTSSFSGGEDRGVFLLVSFPGQAGKDTARRQLMPQKTYV